MADGRKKLSGFEYRKRALDKNKKELDVLSKTAKLDDFFTKKEHFKPKSSNRDCTNLDHEVPTCMMLFQYNPPENARKRKKCAKVELQNAIDEIKGGASIRNISNKYGIDRNNHESHVSVRPHCEPSAVATTGAKYQTYETRICVHIVVTKAEAWSDGTERDSARSFQTLLSTRSGRTTGLVSERPNARVAGKLRPFPKAAPRKTAWRGRQPGKTKILTISPDKETCYNESLTATPMKKICNLNNDNCTKSNDKSKKTQFNNVIEREKLRTVKKSF
ncbi:hypothetical protein EVAR_35914_1 [Eumeta japonica]|uniref:Uncharacterized protein n=1 Tax=Eumeta variegata TaxID=151549 RepID=A0A4C1WVJ4_EUMVA|nr:hypothetical protein EVAR_35914_1 [Eumeta japonica]